MEDEMKSTYKKLYMDVALRIKEKILKGLIDSKSIIVFIQHTMLEII